MHARIALVFAVVLLETFPQAQGPAPACGSTDFQPCRAANTTDQLMFIVKPKIVP